MHCGVPAGSDHERVFQDLLGQRLYQNVGAAVVASAAYADVPLYRRWLKQNEQKDEVNR